LLRDPALGADGFFLVFDVTRPSTSCVART
jgi:hypothetical protein